jgi:hypothetical protein
MARSRAVPCWCRKDVADGDDADGRGVAMTEEDESKDRFFERVGELSEEMIVAHGKDFTMGTLLFAARFIAAGKPLVRPKSPQEPS